MTTFTLGLGARGRMIYSSSYKTDTSGDYFSVAQGRQADSTADAAGLLLAIQRHGLQLAAAGSNT